MPIIITDKNNHTKRINESHFPLEDNLQAYIYANPDVIPIYDIKEDARLFIAAREFPTNSGPIDALGFDESGNIYVIETKLFKNPDKRNVVAQALDYGASLWRNANDFAQFMAQLDTHTNKQFNQKFRDKFMDFFALDDENTDDAFSKMQSNLAEGNIKFVILMDHLDDRLKDLILYVNQNSRFDIYAVDFEYYKHADFEIIIPKLYGSEVKKDVTTRSQSLRKQWNQEMFFDAVDNNHELVNDVQKVAVHKLWDWCNKYDASFNWGTASIYGTFSPIFEGLTVYNRSLFSVSIDSYIAIHYEYLINTEEKMLLRNLLKKYLKNSAPKVTDISDKDLLSKDLHPSISAKIVPTVIDSLIAAFNEFMQLKRKSNDQ